MMSHWSFATSPGLMFLAALVLLGAGALSYANWKRSDFRGSIGGLEGLRFLLVLLLGLTLLRPERVRWVTRSEQPKIVFLVDGSASMTTRDVVVAHGVISRSEWVQRLLDRKPWKPLEGGATISVQHFANPSEATDDAGEGRQGTNLAGALDGVLRRDDDLQAVVLLSDGDWNVGPRPSGVAAGYRDVGVPVFCVAVGSDAPLPDLELASLSPPAYGLLGEQISIPFRIENTLPRNITTTIALLEGEAVRQTKEVTIPAMGELQDAIVWSPQTEGERELTLRVPRQVGEAIGDNNERSARIKVRQETLHVLVVDTGPRWEYRYLRNALVRDPGVDMNGILYLPGLGVGQGRHYLSAFPDTKEAIAHYDVIFLGDVGISNQELSVHDAELIRGLVEQQASGLVFMPGRRGKELSLLDTPLGDLYPVVLDKEKPRGIPLKNESRLTLTGKGKGHWLTRLDANEERNQELWRLLPGFFWSAAVKKSRPGTDVLAVHSSLRNGWGRIPLLVTRPFGAGKVLFMGTDSAWRWRRGVEDRYHYRFWSQVVRWMAHQRHLSQEDGIRLSFSPETPAVGQTVFLQAAVQDRAGYPLENGPVVGKITAPSGRTESLEFAMTKSGWGVFNGSFRSREKGVHRIVVRSAEAGRELETTLDIAQPVVEKIGNAVNAEALKEIASISRGESLGVDEVERLVDRISLLPKPQPRELRDRLWASPFWGAGLLFLLTAYWIGRKFAGLL